MRTGQVQGLPSWPLQSSATIVHQAEAERAWPRVRVSQPQCYGHLAPEGCRGADLGALSYGVASLASTHWMLLAFPTPQLGEPKMFSDIIKCPLRGGWGRLQLRTTGVCLRRHKKIERKQ